MAQKINRRPKGLQSLLDSKNLGVNPSGLSETAAPVVQLDDLLYVDLVPQFESSVESVSSADVLTPKGLIEIPIGETWAIKHWGCTLVATQATTTPISLALCTLTRLGGGFTIASNATTDPVNVQLVDGAAVGFTFERPLIKTGGNVLGAVIIKGAGLVGTSNQINNRCEYFRLLT